MHLITSQARAYVYAGDWVADCPRQCGGTEYLCDRQVPRDTDSPRIVRKGSFLCSYCKMLADIDWPSDTEGIMRVLELRPVPHNRNWYPADHTVAVRAGIPHGQSVRDLEDENFEHGIYT